MRIVLLTSPCAYGAIIMNAISQHADIELVGVGLTNRVYKNKGLLATVRTAVKRMGWRYTIYNALVGDVAWTWLRLTRRPQGLAVVPRNNVWLIDDINSADSVSKISDVQPDYVVSYYFNQWIGPEIREVPSQDCINVHPSLLPAFRGPDPAFRMLERGHSAGGVTIHRVTDDFDAGVVLSQGAMDVSLNASVFSNYCDFALRGSNFLCDWLVNHQQSERPAPSPDLQLDADSCSAEYDSFPTPQEVKQFLKSGKRLIGLRELWRQLRAIA